jgi:hypothetical protein
MMLIKLEVGVESVEEFETFLAEKNVLKKDVGS